MMIVDFYNYMYIYIYTYYIFSRMIIHGSFEIGQAVEMCKSKKVGVGLAKCFRVSLAMSQNASFFIHLV